MAYIQNTKFSIFSVHTTEFSALARIFHLLVGDFICKSELMSSSCRNEF